MKTLLVFHSNHSFSRSNICYDGSFKTLSSNSKIGAFEFWDDYLNLNFSVGYGESFRYFMYSNTMELVRGNTRLLYTRGVGE